MADQGGIVMSTQKTIRQQKGTVEENALRLEPEKAEQIIDALNTDLADIPLRVDGLVHPGI
ncbi:hypothetical protein EL22_28985 [Halostagnicola sp. A56]|nr:hypothetical protein EL22_28985 [Halostagnicola sp. A56]